MIDLKKYHLEISNKKALKLIKIFSWIAFAICLLATFILLIYNYYLPFIIFYKTSILIFQIGLTTVTFSIICGIFFSNYEYLK